MKTPLICIFAILLVAGCSEPKETAQKNTPQESKPMDSAEQPRKEPKYITVQHCLIAFKGTLPDKPVTRTREEAKALAEQILEKVKAGENFLDLIKAHTDDSPPGIYKMANRGIPPTRDFYSRDGMVGAFGDVGFSLEVGGVGLADFNQQSSPYGYHVIKRLD